MSRDEPDDAELRAAFAELRGAEEAGAPPLEALLSRRRETAGDGHPAAPRRVRSVRTNPDGARRAHPTREADRAFQRLPARHLGRLAAAAAVVLAAGLGLWLGDGGRDRRSAELAAEAAALSAWVAPTDFLLDTPGSELLRTTPEIPGPLPPLLTTSATALPTGDPR